MRIVHKYGRATAILLFLIAGVSGCGGGGGGNGGGPVVTSPSILTQPQNVSILVGGSATFSVTADGTAPLQYQWRRDGVDITGANASTLTLSGLTTNDSGRAYSVLVRNGGGSITSANALLTVIALPAISQQPQNQSIFVGGTATFAVTATGTAPLQYQWRRNGSDIAGATLSSLTLNSLTLGDSGTSFAVVVTNAGGSTTSLAALLTVTVPPQPPAITQQPLSVAVTVGGNAVFTMSATGTAPLQYQWRRNGVDIAGATASTLTLNSVTIDMNGTLITVAVTNIAGTTTSTAAVLTVNLASVGSNTIALTANDLIYDRNRNVIYASVPANNSVAVIDASTGGINSYIAVGNHPGVLAISDDTRYLYVALSDDPQVNRIDLATKSVDLTILLGSTTLGALFVTDMKVLPGSPRSIAASLHYANMSPSSAGVAVFDDATRRNAITSFVDKIGPIEFGATAARLYGFDDQTTGYELSRMSVTPSGVATVDTQMSLIMGIDVDIRFDSGALYSSTGSVVDPEARLLLGSFPIDGHISPFSTFTAAAAVRPDVANQRVYFLLNVGGSWQIQAFNSTTLTPTGYLTVVDTSISAGSLIRCGANGLAFRTDNNIYLVTTGSFQVPPALPNPGPGAINLAVNDMVSDSARGLIYASVPGNVYGNGNSIAVINPSTEAVTRYIPVGSEPRKLALSDDMHYLYVAHDGAGVIKRIDLTTLAIDQTIVLNPIGRNLLVDDIDALPGNPNAFAITRRSCCSFPDGRGIAIYDNGVKRVRETQGGGGDDESTIVTFGTTSTRLYGYAARSNNYEFNRLNVDTLGVVAGDSMTGLIGGPATEFKYDGGLIYVHDVAIDPEARVVVRTFPLAASGFSVAPDAVNNRVYYLSAPGAWQIEGFNATTTAALGIAVIGDESEYAGNLLRWGANGLAFSTSNHRIYFRRTTDLQ